MSTPEWIHYKTDPCYGASDPNGNADVYNRANKDLWSNFSAYNSGTGEHDRDGDHMSDLVTNLWVVEEGTFTGNGADDRNISLSDSGLDIKFIRVWGVSIQYTFLCSEDMGADETKGTSNTAFSVDYIQDVSTTGQFQVGTALNVNLTVFYYVCYGVT